MSKLRARQVVKQYGRVLRQNRVSFSHLYLFGSYATGRARKDSDIDIAVIVSKEPHDRIDTEMQLRRLTPLVDIRIEPIVLTKKEFKESTVFTHEVKKQGLRVV